MTMEETINNKTTGIERRSFMGSVGGISIGSYAGIKGNWGIEDPVTSTNFVEVAVEFKFRDARKISYPVESPLNYVIDESKGILFLKPTVDDETIKSIKNSGNTVSALGELIQGPTEVGGGMAMAIATTESDTPKRTSQVVVRSRVHVPSLSLIFKDDAVLAESDMQSRTVSAGESVRFQIGRAEIARSEIPLSDQTGVTEVDVEGHVKNYGSISEVRKLTERRP